MAIKNREAYIRALLNIGVNPQAIIVQTADDTLAQKMSRDLRVESCVKGDTDQLETLILKTITFVASQEANWVTVQEPNPVSGD